MLRCAWDLTLQTGSLARGVDGLNLEDYQRELGLLQSTLKALKRELRDARYRPSPLRRVYIDKPGGRGRRPIDIPTVEDRIVDRALLLVLAPLLEPHWHTCSIGFRAGHGPQDGLAMLEWLARRRELHILQALDIRRAFTSIPKERLVHAVRRALPDEAPEQLATLVEQIIRRPLPRGECVRQSSGIAQGSPLSPLFLNIYLDRHLDSRWDHQRWPMIRYADDILLLTDSYQDAEDAVAALRTLLRPNGLNPRDEIPSAADLRAGDTADWLGYRLRVDGRRLRVAVTDDAWRRLEDGLRAAQGADDLSGRLRRQTLRGWLEYAAPAFRTDAAARPYRRDLVDRISALLDGVGMDTHRMPTRVIHHTWATAHRRWRRRRRRIWYRLENTSLWWPWAPPRASKTAVAIG